MNGILASIIVYFLSLLFIGLIYFDHRRSPKPPRTKDEIEVVISSLRGRLSDLEERFESRVKRDITYAYKDKKGLQKEISSELTYDEKMMKLRERKQLLKAAS